MSASSMSDTNEFFYPGRVSIVEAAIAIILALDVWTITRYVSHRNLSSSKQFFFKASRTHRVCCIISHMWSKYVLKILLQLAVEPHTKWMSGRSEYGSEYKYVAHQVTTTPTIQEGCSGHTQYPCQWNDFVLLTGISRRGVHTMSIT